MNAESASILKFGVHVKVLVTKVGLYFWPTLYQAVDADNNQATFLKGNQPPKEGPCKL